MPLDFAGQAFEDDGQLSAIHREARRQVVRGARHQAVTRADEAREISRRSGVGGLLAPRRKEQQAACRRAERESRARPPESHAVSFRGAGQRPEPNRQADHLGAPREGDRPDQRDGEHREQSGGAQRAGELELAVHA